MFPDLGVNCRSVTDGVLLLFPFPVSVETGEAVEGAPLMMAVPSSLGSDWDPPRLLHGATTPGCSPQVCGVGTCASHLDSQDPERFSGSKGFGVGRQGLD